MTKFVGVAKASRARRAPGGTAADKRVALAMYALTGEHPEQQEEVTAGTSLDVAPDPTGTHVHFTFAVDGAPLDPVVCALFDDKAPATAREFRARAIGAEGRLGKGVEYEGAPVMCVAHGVRVDVGGSGVAAAAPSGVHKAPALEDPSLRHDQPGLISMAALAARVSFTLAACPELDGRQQVVGRVISGLATLETLSKLDADAACKPLKSVLVCCCGAFASAGATERTLALAAEARAQAKAKAFAEKAETPAETRTRLALESSAARGAVDDAVQEALERGKRRKLAEAEAHPAGVTAGRGRTMFDALLGDVSSSDDGEA
jgi:cyclophilin family peptidyl-prolyl cis-trans isomerase